VLLAAFLDHEHLHAFLLTTIRLGAWLLLLAVVFLPLERLFAVRQAPHAGFFF